MEEKGTGGSEIEDLACFFSPPLLSSASQTRAMWPFYWGKEWVAPKTGCPLLPEGNIPCISPPSNLSPQPQAFKKLVSVPRAHSTGHRRGEKQQNPILVHLTWLPFPARGV